MKFALQIALVIIGLQSASANALLTVYSNRSSFVTAIGSGQIETFDSFPADQSFQTSAVTIGGATLLGYGSNPVGFNFIDVAPYLVPVDINGTTFLLGDVSTGSGFTITYSKPITAWGADFVDLQNQATRTSIEFVGAGTITPTVNPSNRALTFFGVTSSTPFTTIRFNSINSGVADGFAIDNMTTPVPEVSSALLLLLGLSALSFAKTNSRPNRAG